MDLLGKILDDYSYYLRVERGLSDNTELSYRSDVEEFCDMARREGAPLEQIGVAFTLDEGLGMIARAYGLRS